MALEVGCRIAHYAVTALIGEGGMGQVYQATDTKLNRQVALKILPEAFAVDPDRLARFRREAHVLASLNHQGIAQIHGIEEQEGTQALVLELVEGPTLADRIAQGPIPVDEALPIAKQIAEALEAAHEAGVIHRDLKPANIKVREDGTVKVLDFGLAKAFQPETGDVSASMSPTISLTAAATQMGMVIGTAAYMAPEQASGKSVDRRADVWALGVVLYEMLTGARPFAADDVSKTLAHVIATDPDWSTLPDNLPPVLVTFLRRCLEKAPGNRVHDVADVRLAIEGAFETEVGSPPASVSVPRFQVWLRPIPAAMVVLISVVVTGLVVWSIARPESVPPGLVRFNIVPPDRAPLIFDNLHRDLAISPNGTRVVYDGPDATGSAAPQLYLRLVDQLEGAPLRGSEGAVDPFFSPNGEWVGFVHFQDLTTLQKVSTSGGPPVTVAKAPNPIMGASWGGDDYIVFGTSTLGDPDRVAGPGLFRVSAGGGEPELLTTLDVEQGETSHIWPSIIPGRQAVLLVIGSGAPASTGQLAVFDLTTREMIRLGLPGVSPRYFSTGHLVYAAQNGSVQAVPFDASSLTVTGGPVPLVEGVSVKRSGAANFSISDTGHLVYTPGASDGFLERSLVWVDRAGQETAIKAPLRAYQSPRVSPDGRQIAVEANEQNNDIWVFNTPDGPLTRLTFGPEYEGFPHWSPDGERVYFSSARDRAVASIFWKAADGTGTATHVAGDGGTSFLLNGVTPDGTRLIASNSDIGSGSGDDLVMVTVDAEPAVETLVGTEFSERNAALSPDGAWLAFQSDESGVYEVYVRPFPDVEAGRWQVSTAGGYFPAWSPNGSELFFLQDTRLMAVSVQVDDGFTYGTPEALFDVPYYFGGIGLQYDVAPDGRFLMVKTRSEDVSLPGITVVLNWTQELLERVPVN